MSILKDHGFHNSSNSVAIISEEEADCITDLLISKACGKGWSAVPDSLSVKISTGAC